MAFCTLGLFAQKNEPMEIYTFQQHQSEHTNPEKNKTTTFVSGTQDNKVVNVTVVRTATGSIAELTINKTVIAADDFVKYQELTNYIAAYADTPREQVTLEEVKKAKADETIKEVAYRKDLNDALIAELLKDELIEEDTEVYDLMILFDKMYFNGKQQTEEMAKRYKDLYESLSGVKIERTTFYHLSQTL